MVRTYQMNSFSYKTLFTFGFLVAMYLFHLKLRPVPYQSGPLRRPTKDVWELPVTDLSRGYEKSGISFWTRVKPGFTCPKGLLRRQGKPFRKEGGKWICGVVHLKKSPCVLYSFGVGGDSTFEAVILKKTQCSVYGYDNTVTWFGYPLNRKTYESEPRLSFQEIGLRGEEDLATSGGEVKMKSISELMNENNHTWIDLLKLDIEGSEVDCLKRFLQDFQQSESLPVGQLLVEFHDPNNSYDMLYPLISELEGRGMRLFRIEMNDENPDCCAELSFINVAALHHFLSESQVEAILTNTTVPV